MKSTADLFKALDSHLAAMRPSMRQRVLTALAEKLARDVDPDLVRRLMEASLKSVGAEVDLRDWQDMLCGRE